MVPSDPVNEMKRFVSEYENINIFDVFAKLYYHCEPTFPVILEEARFTKESRRISRLEEGYLKTVGRALVAEGEFGPLERDQRQRILSALPQRGDNREFNTHCYALLRAIDASYGLVAARQESVEGNSPSDVQRLNMNVGVGHVYSKKTSPIHTMIENRVKELRDDGWSEREVHLNRTVMGLRYKLNHLTCVRIPDGYSVDIGVLDNKTWMSLSFDVRDLKIALVPLVDEVRNLRMCKSCLDTEVSIPIRYGGLRDPERHASRAVEWLRDLNEIGAALVLFPELCVPEQVRSAIAQSLKGNHVPSVRIVVAGSFHEKLEEPWQGYYNVAHILGHDGQLLWRQTKFAPYRLMHYEAASIPALTGFANKDSYEWITLLPRVLFVREAPFGRIALLICSDLLLRENLRQLLIELSVNVILVPAMSWSVGGDFLSAAKELAEYNQAITVVSNACAMPREARSGKRKGKGVKVSFVVVPASPGVWWCSCDTDAGPCDTRKCVGDFVLQLGSWPKGFDKMKMS